MDDATSRSPELDAILCCSTLQEVEDFFVSDNGSLATRCQRSQPRHCCTDLKVRFSPIERLNQVLTMYTRWLWNEHSASDNTRACEWDVRTTAVDGMPHVMNCNLGMFRILLVYSDTPYRAILVTKAN